MGSHGVMSPASKSDMAWVPLSMGLQVLTEACSSAGLCNRVTASFRNPPALAWGAFPWLQVEICSTVVLHGLQGNNLPHRGLHYELQGKSLCSDILGTSSPPPSLILVSAKSFPSHRLALLSNHHLTQRFFLPFLKYIITEALPPWLTGLSLGSSGSVLEPANTGFIKHRGSFSQTLTEDTPIAPPATKTLQHKPITNSNLRTHGEFPYSPLLTPPNSFPESLVYAISPVIHEAA